MWRNYLMTAKSIRLAKKAISNYLLETKFSFKTKSQLKWKGRERDRPWQSNACVSSRQGDVVHITRDTAVLQNRSHRGIRQAQMETGSTAELFSTWSNTDKAQGEEASFPFSSLTNRAQEEHRRKEQTSLTKCGEPFSVNRDECLREQTMYVWGHKVGSTDLKCLEAHNRSSLTTSGEIGNRLQKQIWETPIS